MSDNGLRVLVIDEHPVARLGVSLVLRESGFFMVGEADNTTDAIDQCNLLRPNVLIMEVSGEKFDALTIIRKVSSDLGVKFIIFSSRSEVHYCRRFISAGASAFVSKNNDPQVLIEALNSLHSGKSHFSFGSS